jgi:hypothetical protein
MNYVLLAIWSVWLVLTASLILTTLVTTMADRAKDAFASVVLLVIVGFSAPTLYLMGLLWPPFSMGVAQTVPYDMLLNAAFAVPQLIGILILLAIYVSLHLLGYTKGISASFFIFVKPFYAAQYIQVKIDQDHIGQGKRNNIMESPICLALCDLVEQHGYKPLYAFFSGNTCRLVTSDATMELQVNKRVSMFQDNFNRFRPVHPTVVTLKVLETKLDEKESIMAYLGRGFLAQFG